ncbi:hypothetical protein V6N12_030782 [Hibiscus sabdariffa]|uniref:Uncharacterized protein n=1 Tax=Hibiscus sabdariffa TaxID=183260 RepID=A0ABR2E725_9ROSI
MGELREREKVRKVREWESLGKGRTQKHIQTTVFVSNLPPRLHWKESSSDSSSVPDHYTGSTNRNRSNCNGEDETSSEAVPSVLNVTSTEAIGPYIHVNHPVVSWADVVARHSPEQTSQGDRAGEVISRMHNQNGELDPITGLEGCEAHSRRIPTDKVMDREEFGICLSATKRNLKVEKPILSAGKLANCVNLELESLTLPLS